jgi:hypothetical protein
MSDIDPREFGRLEAGFESMKHEIGEVKAELTELNQTMKGMQAMLHEARGGGKVMQWMLAAPGGAALVAWLAEHWSGVK